MQIIIKTTNEHMWQQACRFYSLSILVNHSSSRADKEAIWIPDWVKTWPSTHCPKGPRSVLISKMEKWMPTLQPKQGLGTQGRHIKLLRLLESLYRWTSIKTACPTTKEWTSYTLPANLFPHLHHGSNNTHQNRDYLCTWHRQKTATRQQHSKFKCQPFLWPPPLLFLILLAPKNYTSPALQ